MFLDYLTPTKVSTQFELGTNGYLGVQDIFITHKKKFYANAIGAHSPSSIEYELDGSYNTFEADVCINDIKEEQNCNPVNFSVYADGNLVAYIPRVRAHESSRSIYANIYGAKKLRLDADILYDGYNNWCQSVWLLPQIHQEKTTRFLSATRDCEIIFSDTVIKSEKCIFTTACLDDIDDLVRMLKTLKKHNNIDDIPIVVFAFGNLNKFEKLATDYGALIVQCNIIDEYELIDKSVIASLAVHNIVNAQSYMYLSSNMLIMDNILEVFNLLDHVDSEKILICTNPITNIVGQGLKNIISSKESVYGGQDVDYEILRMDDLQQHYPFIVNTDLFCLSKKSILALEQTLKEMMPYSLKWKNSNPKFVALREQAIINCSIAKIAMGIELSNIYNCQLAANTIDDIEITKNEDDYSIVRKSDNKKIKALNINELVAAKYIQLCDFYSSNKG